MCLVEASGSNGASPVTPTGTGWGMETPAAHHLGMCQDARAHTHTGIFTSATVIFSYSYIHIDIAFVSCWVSDEHNSDGRKCVCAKEGAWHFL